MDVVRFADAPFYTAPGHEDVTARRLQGGEASSADFALIGHSTLRPGAVMPMAAVPFGRIYVVSAGEIAVEQFDGATHILRTGDSIFIPADEPRSVRNDGAAEAAMMVVTPPVI